MKYVVLLAGDGDVPPWPELSEEEQGALMERFAEFDEVCAARDGVEILSGEALQDGSAATTLRTRGGELSVTEGPFAEAFEGLGGFYLIETPSLDVLIEVLAALPPYDIELRPVADVDMSSTG